MVVKQNCDKAECRKLTTYVQQKPNSDMLVRVDRSQMQMQPHGVPTYTHMDRLKQTNPQLVSEGVVSSP